MKRVIRAASEDPSKEIVQFLKTVDMEPLFQEIRNRVDDGTLDFSFKIIDGNNPYIKFSTGNISESCGILSAAINYTSIESSNGGVMWNAEFDSYDYWTAVGFHWEYHDGGSNGVNILQATYSSGSWNFR